MNVAKFETDQIPATVRLMCCFRGVFVAGFKLRLREILPAELLMVIFFGQRDAVWTDDR